jgi:cytochrome P450
MTTGTEEARIPLDPFVTDLDGESARLRAAGPLAAVELPGGVPVWAVTHHAEAKALLTDPRLVKDINVWGAWQRGEIPADWPLIGLANPGRSMLTVDGADGGRVRHHPHLTEPAHRLRARPARVPRRGPVPPRGRCGAPRPLRALPRA